MGVERRMEGRMEGRVEGVVRGGGGAAGVLV